MRLEQQCRRFLDSDGLRGGMLAVTLYNALQTGMDIQSSHFEMALFSGVLTGLGTCYELRAQTRAEVRAFRAGLEMGMNMQGPTLVGFEMAHSDEPRYTSLDGTKTIRNPEDLFQTFMAMSEPPPLVIMHIINQGRKGKDLSIDDIEILRQAQAVLRMSPGLEHELCDAGQQFIGEMDQIVTKYEEQYRAEHPTTTE